MNVRKYINPPRPEGTEGIEHAQFSTDHPLADRLITIFGKYWPHRPREGQPSSGKEIQQYLEGMTPEQRARMEK